MSFLSFLGPYFELAAQLVMPWLFMGYAALHIPRAIYDTVRNGQWSNFSSPYNFSDAIFATFWTTIGPQIKQDCLPTTLPLLQGRMKNGRVVDDPAYPPIHGIVMEVGAGSGMWLDVLQGIRDEQVASSTTGHDNKGSHRSSQLKITNIYGVEPNSKSNKALQKRVDDLGFGEYQVVPVGIEDVTDSSKWNGYIAPGSIDCVITQSCLCSIPEPEKNIRLLYSLLKPGGYWYMSEHVQQERGGFLLSLYQRKCTNHVSL